MPNCSCPESITWYEIYLKSRQEETEGDFFSSLIETRGEAEKTESLQSALFNCRQSKTSNENNGVFPF